MPRPARNCVPSSTSGLVTSVAFSPDGKRLASYFERQNGESCGMPRPARSCSLSRGTAVGATTWPSAPTATAWPAPGGRHRENLRRHAAAGEAVNANARILSFPAPRGNALAGEPAPRVGSASFVLNLTDPSPAISRNFPKPVRFPSGFSPKLQCTYGENPHEQNCDYQATSDDAQISLHSRNIKRHVSAPASTRFLLTTNQASPYDISANRAQKEICPQMLASPNLKLGT